MADRNDILPRGWPSGAYIYTDEQGESWTLDIERGPARSASANSSLKLISEFGTQDDFETAKSDLLEIEKLSDVDLRALGATLAKEDATVRPYKSRREVLQVLVRDVLRDRERQQERQDRSTDIARQDWQFHIAQATSVALGILALVIAYLK